ncbi:MAG TPA: HyaD/HybD family hydrogenase maturation endopeptidase [Xanthomonadales bacterium]|nr:HyaD/HybD family hydrogenase maturation endopeptidase [Xanthomonadales bacterium]
MRTPSHKKHVLVMGVGNTLLQDDGVGIHVTNRLRAENEAQRNVAYLDGGTIGLSLLPSVEDADALIIVDAAEMNAPPGTVRIFRDAEIERQMSGRKRSVHEVAISDLLSAASLRGTCPAQCALVAIQPFSTDLGLEPTPLIQAAILTACAAVNELTGELTRGYQHET